jgi:hypothetical protein
VTPLVAAALAFGLAATAHAQTSALGNVDVASDTDGFHATRVRAGALHPDRSDLDYLGVAAQTTHYAQAGWAQDAPGVVAVFRRQERATLAGINGEAGVVEVGGHARAVGDVTWSSRPAQDTGVELIAAGDLVATRKAIDRGIAYGFFAASVEHTFVERVTAIALAGYQPFTDGNDRVHFRARVIWSALPEQGINLQLRWRQYRSGKDDVDGAYFNPDRYEQWQAAAGVRRRFGGWVVSGSFGAGRERIDGTDTHPVRVAEMRAEGALTEHTRLAFYALYSRTTAYVDAPDYSYRQAGITLIHRF